MLAYRGPEVGLELSLSSTSVRGLRTREGDIGCRLNPTAANRVTARAAADPKRLHERELELSAWDFVVVSALSASRGSLWSEASLDPHK